MAIDAIPLDDAVSNEGASDSAVESRCVRRHRDGFSGSRVPGLVLFFLWLLSRWVSEWADSSISSAGKSVGTTGSGCGCLLCLVAVIVVGLWLWHSDVFDGLGLLARAIAEFAEDAFDAAVGFVRSVAGRVL